MFTCVAALSVVGCGGGAGSAATPAPRPSPERSVAAGKPPDDAGAIEALLRDRARALERRDVAAFSSTAAGDQRRRDRRAARRAARLPLERVGYVANELETAGDRARIDVTMSYKVHGAARPFLTPRRVSARRTAAGWRVSRDVARQEPLPWEVASFKATHAPHIVLLTPRGVDAAPLDEGLANAYRRVRDELPRRDMPRSVLVLAARDGAEAERLTGHIARGVIALANVAVRFGPPPAYGVQRVLAQRMIVIESRWAALSEPGRESTLVHEMTHTALDPDTSGRTPAWLVEGAAMYASNDDRAAEARAGPSLRELCRPNSISRLRGREQRAAYAVSSAAAEAIAARHGSKGLFDVYDAFNDSTIHAATCAETTDRVLRRTLGMSLAELDAVVTGG